MKGNNFNTALVKNPKTGALENVCLDTGEILRPVSLHDMEKYKFNFDMALLICQRVREGATLKELGDDPSLPSLTVIHYWRRNNATFDEEIKLARKDRAEYYADRVIEIAEQVVDKDDVPVAKFKSDVYKWAAEKGDPGSYGNKIEHTGSNTATTLVVMTGIERKPDIEVNYEEVISPRPEDKQNEASIESGVRRDSEVGGSEEERAEGTGTSLSSEGGAGRGDSAGAAEEES
jgi:hypothetical protein